MRRPAHFIRSAGRLPKFRQHLQWVLSFTLEKAGSGMALHAPPLFEIRAQAEGRITGYASVFGGVDSYGDSVLPGAFSATLATHKAAQTAPAMLWAHDQARPVGRWLLLAEDSRGLAVEGQLNLKTTEGREAFEHVSGGDLTGFSIGYTVPRDGAKSGDGGVRLLKRIDLYEVSLVTLPADGAARVGSIKHAADRPQSLRDFEQALQQLGYSRREARALAAKGFGALAEPDHSEEIIAAIHAATTLLKGN